MAEKGRDKREIGRTRSGLRYGWTTGSCAAAAAKAAAEMLFGGEEIRQVGLMTPKGIGLLLDVEMAERRSGRVQCAVRKYSGDDPDVTDGLLIFARAEKISEEDAQKAAAGGAFCKQLKDGPYVILDGGDGVGRVTRKGLEQQMGQAAINRVPRRMILEEVEKVCRKYGYSGPLKVIISIPEGAAVAKKTFNPRLGIEGGLSVLGTSGIVEPMSEKALTDTIWLEMKMLKENGHDACYVVPGNYGSDFLREDLRLDPELSVKCSNYVGEAIDDGGLLGMKGLLLIGHIGKFVKLAAGIMNTHSRQADGRMEVLAAHAAMNGADRETVKAIMACLNTTEAVDMLKEKGLLGPVMGSVTERIAFHLRQRSGDGPETGAIVFSNEEGILGQTENAGKLLEMIRSSRLEAEARAEDKKTENGGQK